MLMSPEAEALWSDMWTERLERSSFDLASEREAAEGSGDVLPHPVGVSYRVEAVAGLNVLFAEPERISDPEAVIIWIHGGAFTLMSAHTHRHFAGHLAAEMGSVIALPDYSLAPESPFPTALNELTNVCGVLAQAEPDRPVILIGDSAGGALAVGVQMRLRELGAPQPALTALLCPWLDLTLTNDSISDNAEFDAVLDATTLPANVELYLNGMPSDHPLASPIHGDLNGLGPVYLQAAEHDVLVDDSVMFTRKARLCGVDVEIEIAAEVPHCYQFFAGVIPEADMAISRLAATIRARIASC